MMRSEVTQKTKMKVRNNVTLVTHAHEQYQYTQRKGLYSVVAQKTVCHTHRIHISRHMTYALDETTKKQGKPAQGHTYKHIYTHTHTHAHKYFPGQTSKKKEKTKGHTNTHADTYTHII